MASQALFSSKSSKRPRYRYHTPTTFRAQKRLRFQNPIPIHNNIPPVSPLSPPGVSPPRASFSNSAVSTAAIANNFSTNGNAINAQQLQQFQQLQLPWDTPGAKVTSLYKSSPPNLTYPSGSQDEATNERFKKLINMYLFQNFQVRSVLVGDST